MQIRVPRWLYKGYNTTMDRLARMFLPYPYPVAKVYGYAVDLTDLFAVAWALIAAAAMTWYTGSWWWFPAVAMGMAMVIVLMEMRR